MGSEERMRELVLRFTEDPAWLPSVSQDITDAIHAELADLNADPELRASTYASTDSVLRLIVDLSRSRRPPRVAVPPPAAVDYAREFVRRGLPLDSLLRAYHIGQARFFRRWCTKARETITDPHELTEAVELGANWTFDYVEKLSDGLVQRYGEERERWVRSAAAVRAQVIEALLAGEPVDAERASSRLGYELGRNHLAFAIWSDAPLDRGDIALAMIERAALQLVSSLGLAGPLLVPRARLCLAGWIGSRGDDHIVGLTHAHMDIESFPTVLAAFGSPGVGVTGFARSHREAFHTRRIAQLTQQRAGTVTHYDTVALAALASADLGEAREFVTAELGQLLGDDDQSVRLSATLRVYLEENMSPLRASRRLGVHEHTITNRIRAAQELLPHPIDQRSCELQVALRLLPLAQAG
ncbi:MAG TPA: helix-turn-helix domain-containing protein [Solirubrobacteraceae bacterium]|jgi:DNA-binding PucR family transcriptional regulator|nr:helix-turn-helix domain-containing protein [Solirubrobacteraceae bacterium]